MKLYEIGFGAAAVFLIIVVLLYESMRQQVHAARYGREVSPWDQRYLNGMSGQYGIWTLHKRFYERSALRSSLMLSLVACLLSALLALLNFALVNS